MYVAHKSYFVWLSHAFCAVGHYIYKDKLYLIKFVRASIYFSFYFFNSHEEDEKELGDASTIKIGIMLCYNLLNGEL